MNVILKFSNICLSIVSFVLKTRFLLSRTINKLFLGTLVGSVPSSVVRSIEETYHLSFINKHIIGFYNINMCPSVEKYSFNETFPLYFRRDKAFDARKLYLLKDVTVSPKSGVVWLKEGKILQESIGSLNRLLGWSGALYEIPFPSRYYKQEDILFCCPNVGYYHWLLEVVPNLIYASNPFPNIKIVLHRKVPNYILQSIELVLGSTNFQERIIYSNYPLRVKKLALVGYEPVSGFVPKMDIDTLRRIFLFRPHKNGTPKKVIYVSRRRTQARHLINEEQLEQTLKKLGIEIVYSEELSFSNQIKSFSEAKAIITPHGAGLSNIVWCDSNCFILEIFPSNVFNDCYARLALQLNLHYGYVICENHNGSYGKIPIPHVIEKIEHLLNYIQ